ncbi:MAG: hypothetical protein ABI680_05140, partial [Chthoniobacteraceae bacterium]
GAEGAQIEVLLSTNLVDWQPGDPDLEMVSTQPVGDGRALVTLRVKAPLADADHLYMRLRVTVP